MSECEEGTYISTSDNKSEFLARLYMENYSDMLFFAGKFFQNKDIALDAVQDTFLVVQKKLDDLIASPLPEGWLFNTLKNVIGDTYRRRKRLMEISSIFSLPETPTIDEPNIHTLYDGIIDQADLDLLIRVYCDGMKYAEISEELNISLQVCKKRIQRAKTKLKKALEKEK